MSDTSANNKRIAKNTGMLYIRMLVTMAISLYSSRVFLNALGVVDYGLYNAVGGFVAVFATITSSLSGAISRFLTYALGENNLDKLKHTFSTSIVIQILLSMVVIIIAETIGLWFLENKMVIPEDRFVATFWVFQLAVFSFILGLIIVPYNASIIAHEKMGAFAYISIYEAICKLIICFLIYYSPIDRLIYYSILFVTVSISTSIIYVFYCRRHFEECVFKLKVDRDLISKMFGFASWNFIGSAGWIIRQQGGTILFNLFGGPAVNAANGIASALSGAATSFVNNYTTAFNPQITKSYASKNYKQLNQLLFYGPKMSFFMMLIIGLPVMINAETILQIWLGRVPEYTVVLVRLIIIFSMIETISTALITAKLATGNIRNYQIIVGTIQLLSVPLAYVCLKLEAPIESVYISYIITSIGCLMARLVILRGDIHNFSPRNFLFNVVLNCWFVATVSSVAPLLLYANMEDGWLRFFSTCFVSVITTVLSIWFFGCNTNERFIIISKIRQLTAKYTR